MYRVLQQNKEVYSVHKTLGGDKYGNAATVTKDDEEGDTGVIEDEM
jgi:hypothetical protein